MRIWWRRTSQGDSNSVRLGTTVMLMKSRQNVIQIMKTNMEPICMLVRPMACTQHSLRTWGQELVDLLKLDCSVVSWKLKPNVERVLNVPFKTNPGLVTRSLTLKECFDAGPFCFMQNACGRCLARLIIICNISIIAIVSSYGRNKTSSMLWRVLVTRWFGRLVIVNLQFSAIEVSLSARSDFRV